MKKYLCLISIMPSLVSATGMAVAFNRLYLQNNTAKPIYVQIKNLAESSNTFNLSKHSICQIKQDILFEPREEESNNFVIAVNINNVASNPIVIDQFGLLALASAATIQVPYSGNVKQYSLQGFCGNKLGQFKFINVTTHNNESSAPNFVLLNCQQKTNYVYFINEQYIKVKQRQKHIDFAKVTECK